MRKILTVTALAMLAMLAVGLCNCDGKGGDAPKGKSIMGEQRKAFPAPDTTMAFDIRFELTPEAQKLLPAGSNDMLFEASYYGLPTAASMPHANILHQIDLGQENFAVPLSVGKAHFTGALDRSQLPELVDGVAYMMVQASVRDSVGAVDERIACSTYRGSIAQAQVPDAAVIRCDVARP